MKESRFKRKKLYSELERRFPNCWIFPLDPNHTQGIPDLLILHGRHWAMLETKGFEKASKQPNQGFYVGLFNDLSFAAFIDPDNMEEVLDAMEYTFRSRR